jgi:Zn-dependent protease
MSSILNLSLTLLVLFALIRFVRLLTGTVRLIKMPLWAPLHTFVPRSELGELTPIFDAARIQMVQAGYAYIGTRRERGIVAVPDLPSNYVEAWIHVGKNVYAESAIADMPAPGRTTVTNIKSYLGDGTILLTTNNALPTWHGPNTRVQECDTSDIEGMTAAHLERCTAIGANCAVPDAPSQMTIELASRDAATMLPAMEQTGHVYRSGTLEGEPVFRFRIGYALKAAWKAQRRYDQLRKKVAAAAKFAPPVEPAVHAALFAAQRTGLIRTIGTLRGLSAPRWLQGVSLLISIPAFLAVGTWLWGWQSACVIGAVIAIHEGGHWLAMKLAGFREVQVFFVPGFGGATVGEKYEASPLTHLFVYLAGPLPGLLFATTVFVCAMAHPEFTLATFYPVLSVGASAALFINLFNLLPVMPLDGGRVVDLFLFGRLPWLRFAFGIVSALLILGCGWRYQLRYMEILGLIMFAALPFQYRLAKASAIWRSAASAQSGTTANPVDAIADIVGFLSGPRFQTWNFAAKLGLATAMLPRHLGGTPGWKISILALTIYLASIAVPLGAISLEYHAYPEQARDVLWRVGAGSTASNRASPSDH